MRFRKQTTFNTRDSSFGRDNGRLVITNGVKTRCELAINGIFHFGNKGVKLSQLVSYINGRSTHKYSDGDLSYAVHRLINEGLITVRNDGTYHATQRAKDAWSRLPKQPI